MEISDKLDALLDILDQVYDIYETFSKRLSVACVRGCAACCTQNVTTAAKAARAHEFIVAMPEGYDTQVGERGATVSGGQKQRIAIARALLKDPRILILDDATSSVDTATELLVQQALARLMEGRTSFVIAQRLSTIRQADQILVLQDGRIVARGERTPEHTAHDDLLRTSGLYADIYHRQLRPQEAG